MHTKTHICTLNTQMFINLNAHTSEQMHLILMATDTLEVLGVTIALFMEIMPCASTVKGLIFKDVHRMIRNVNIQQFLAQL